MHDTNEFTTVPMRQFEVEDAAGRRYRITRYVWLANVAGEKEPKLWRELREVFLSDTGGWLEPIGQDRYEIDGTETVVTECKWSRPSPG